MTASDPTAWATRLAERATFGARPGAIDAIARQGGDAWLAGQLAPASIDDADCEARVAEVARRELVPGDLDAPLRDPRRMRGSDAKRLDAARSLGERLHRCAAHAAAVRLVRAVHGRRELHEVMVDFWANHFSVFARKGPVAAWLEPYEREVLRPHALGRFEDLLLAVARSPAMLFYLDNVRSGVPRMEWPLRLAGVRDRAPSGINENYARELLELHTLGVDGGYGQDDVVAAARVLSGWSLDRDTQRFRFREFLHDGEPKRFLGVAVPGEGEAEGEWLLRQLARHPSTARFVCAKLARRFVADDPPRALVARAAARWLETEGHVPAVLQVLLGSEAFVAPGHRKLKTPVEFAASALRATDGTTDGGRGLQRRLRALGELPFFARTPEGHPDRTADWATPAGMLGRVSLAFELTRRGDGATRAGDAAPAATAGEASPRGERVALALADPEFQWQ